MQIWKFDFAYTIKYCDSCAGGVVFLTLAVDRKRVDGISPEYVFSCNKDDFNDLNNFVLFSDYRWHRKH